MVLRLQSSHEIFARSATEVLKNSEDDHPILMRFLLEFVCKRIAFCLAMEDTAKLAITAGRLRLCLNIAGLRCRGADPPM